MKKYVIKLNNKVYEVEIEEVTGANGVAASNGEAAATITQSTKQAPAVSQPQTSGGLTIKAPMAGSILSIAAKVGDQIKKDQTLMILEAMKMENEISSPVDGTVLSIGVSKGDMVNAGIVLIQIG